MIRRFVDLHGHRTLSMIARSDFEAYFRQLEKEGKKFGTLERIRSSLAGMFKAAVEDGVIEKNPMRGIRRYPKVPRSRVLSDAEEIALMAELTPVWQRFVRMALLTGMRRSELLMDSGDTAGIARPVTRHRGAAILDDVPHRADGGTAPGVSSN
jgi:integrase